MEIAIPLGAGALAFFSALFVGTAVEYFVHRLMHRGKLLGRKHAEHHQDGDGQGWWGEFVDYFLGSMPVNLVGFLVCFFGFGSWAAGVGFVLGGASYAVLAAYSHQLQHEKPDLCFWLPRPVHYLHHKHRMWKHNFGITFDFWDRICGTYKRVDWRRECRLREVPLTSYLRIRWF